MSSSSSSSDGKRKQAASSQAQSERVKRQRNGEGGSVAAMQLCAASDDSQTTEASTSSLWQACCTRSVPLVRRLASHANEFVLDDLGGTPHHTKVLDACVHRGWVDVAIALVESSHVLEIFGTTLLQIALDNGWIDLFCAMVKCPGWFATPNAAKQLIRRVIRRGSGAAMQALIDVQHSALVNDRNNEFLQYAIRCDEAEVVDVMLSSDLYVDADNMFDKDGVVGGPLWLAHHWRKRKVVEMLECQRDALVLPVYEYEFHDCSGERPEPSLLDQLKQNPSMVSPDTIARLKSSKADDHGDELAQLVLYFAAHNAAALSDMLKLLSPQDVAALASSSSWESASPFWRADMSADNIVDYLTLSYRQQVLRAGGLTGEMLDKVLECAIEQSAVDVVDLLITSHNIDLERNLEHAQRCKLLPLHIAISYNAVDVMRLLIFKHGRAMNVDTFSWSGGWPSVHALRVMLCWGGPSLVQRNNTTALANAVANHSTLLVEALVREARVDVQATQDVLHNAIQQSAPLSIVEALVGAKGGASLVNKRSLAGDLTPLQCACLAARPSIVRFLLSNGADVSVRDARGQSLLHLVCRHDSDAQVGCSEIIDLILAHGGEEQIQAKDSQGRVPLLEAGRAKTRHAATLARLHHGHEDAGERFEFAESVCSDMSLGHCAARNGWLDIIRECCDRGWEILGSDWRCQETPLLSACYAGRQEVVRRLVADFNANVWANDTDGWTPMSSAAADNWLDVIHAVMASPWDDGHVLNGWDHGEPPIEVAIRCKRRAAALVLVRDYHAYASFLLPQIEELGWTEVAAAIRDNQARGLDD
eukprot:TRINITY_DN48215_c0_g1_i1.p1 TRINITY_DN48215_c0_g1~~TRINITY_DN48215_c0_g1_i1.p1  ORF type:complete len:818 (+),score=324.35 TRINITY_DN48215_c0_g1_i1:85-2538(+)